MSNVESILSVLEKHGVTHIFDPKPVKHYGVKGMKWGVRKRRASASSSVENEGVMIRKNEKSGKLEAAGGRGHKPSEDALKATAYRQKAKASGTHSLTNQELKVIVDRMNLEGQYAKLLAANPPYQHPAKKFLKDFLKDEQNTLMSGKPTKSQKIIQFAMAQAKARKAKNAAKVVGKALAS